MVENKMLVNIIMLIFWYSFVFVLGNKIRGVNLKIVVRVDIRMGCKCMDNVDNIVFCILILGICILLWVWFMIRIGLFMMVFSKIKKLSMVIILNGCVMLSWFRVIKLISFLVNFRGMVVRMISG